MRLLLTGSNGFVGARIAADAADRGWEVVGVGRRATPTTPVTHYLRHDLGEPLAWDEPVDAVLHAAALSSPWAAPGRFHRDNVEATRLILDWAEQHGRPYFGYISTTSVLYRDGDQFGLTEATATAPDAAQINAYALTKLLGERLTQRYCGAWSILRPRAVFGVGDTVLLPRVITAARSGVLPRFTRADRSTVLADLTPVQTVSHYALSAVEQRSRGLFHLVNGESVELDGFVDDLLTRLGLHPRRPRVSLPVAMAMARSFELFSAAFLGYAEPPITRYGVSMFAHSKTFDAGKVRGEFGPAPITVADAVDQLISTLG